LAREKIAKTTPTDESIVGEMPETKPDVYFICMDGYGRQDILKEIYDYDNSAFIDFLKERNFWVADESFSNYCQTLLSLGATFNLNYIDSLGDFDPGSYDRLPLAEMFWDNEVFRQFKSRGYSNVVFSSGYTFTEFENADKYFASAWAISEFNNILLATTPLPLLLYNEKSLFDSHRKRVNYILNKLPEIYEVGSPKFMFAHILCPHPPFVFDADGQNVQVERTFSFEDGSHYMNNGGSVEEYLRCYKAQISYITARLRETIKKIFDNYGDNPPVIIIEADHGPGSGLSWVGMDKTNLVERFSILNVVYLPGIDPAIDYRHFSPVNTFRLLFDLYFKTDFGLLPNHSYYTTWAHPYNFREVTRIINPTAYDARDFIKSPVTDYARVSRPQKQGTKFNAEGCCLVGDEGVIISSLPSDHSDHLEISVDHDDGYVLYFRKDTTLSALVNVVPKRIESGGLRVDTLIVPEPARQKDYDNILVSPYAGDGRYSLGHLRFIK
ncbi:MAG: sulfatase-like hydrolase/transferase, partial [Candidatus Zixiibacteriota bacterium]